jgi:hypothetical protein
MWLLVEQLPVQGWQLIKTPTHLVINSSQRDGRREDAVSSLLESSEELQMPASGHPWQQEAGEAPVYMSQACYQGDSQRPLLPDGHRRKT